MADSKASSDVGSSIPTSKKSYGSHLDIMAPLDAGHVPLTSPPPPLTHRASRFTADRSVMENVAMYERLTDFEQSPSSAASSSAGHAVPSSAAVSPPASSSTASATAASSSSSSSSSTTLRGCMKSSKGTTAGDEQKKHVAFSCVNLIFCPRTNGCLANGVPKQGAYPLGLDHTKAAFAQTELDVDAFESHQDRRKRRYPCPGAPADKLERLSEAERKELIVKSGLSLPAADDDEAIHERLELNQLRRGRSRFGCNCTGTCEPSSCQCMQDGVTCVVMWADRDSWPCECSDRGCANPLGRYEYSPDDVHKIRLRVLSSPSQPGKVQPDQTT